MVGVVVPREAAFAVAEERRHSRAFRRRGDRRGVRVGAGIVGIVSDFVSETETDAETDTDTGGETGVGGPTRGNVYIGDVDAPDPMNPPPVRRPYTASTRSPPGVTSSTLTPPGFLSAPLMTRPSDPEWNSGL